MLWYGTIWLVWYDDVMLWYDAIWLLWCMMAWYDMMMVYGDMLSWYDVISYDLELWSDVSIYNDDIVIIRSRFMTIQDDLIWGYDFAIWL